MFGVERLVTSLLAGLFPEQKIISIWEGDTDALGYNGFFVLVLK
jgi:hypothetical protein